MGCNRHNTFRNPNFRERFSGLQHTELEAGLESIHWDEQELWLQANQDAASVEVTLSDQDLVILERARDRSPAAAMLLAAVQHFPDID
jgi:hypothetical protein